MLNRNRLMAWSIRVFLTAILLGGVGSQAVAQTPAPNPEPEPIFVGESSTGYIDTAIPATQFRLRFDSTYDSRRNTRADFLWAWPQGSGAGMPFDESKINDQRVTTYFEYKAGCKLSGFVEIGARFVNPEINANAEGLDDMNVGFKYAFVQNQDFIATLQLRTYIPTGEADAGLGNSHVALEPALLSWMRLTDRVRIESELRYWIPLNDPDNWAGSVLRYGVGGTVDVFESQNLRLSPVAELVGWTALGGQTRFITPIGVVTEGASGDTIVNAKLGVRLAAGCAKQHQFYLGYGRALTGENWYRDVVRLEYRLAF